METAWAAGEIGEDWSGFRLMLDSGWASDSEPLPRPMDDRQAKFDANWISMDYPMIIDLAWAAGEI